MLHGAIYRQESSCFRPRLECEVQLAYAIGVAEPVSVMVNTFGTGKVAEERLAEFVRANFPLTPKGIIDHLKLRRPIYRKTAAFGHFGRRKKLSPGKPPIKQTRCGQPQMLLFQWQSAFPVLSGQAGWVPACSFEEELFRSFYRHGHLKEADHHFFPALLPIVYFCLWIWIVRVVG